MIEFYIVYDIPDNFTGICKTIYDNSIRYYKNGMLHREDGPSLICLNGNKYWFINGSYHREDGPAVEYSNGGKIYYYKDKYYNSNFTNETWKEKVECLKREEELKVFI